MDLLALPHYKTNVQRVENRVDLAKDLEGSFFEWEAAVILEKCHQNYVPIGQVRNMKEVFEQQAAVDLILEEKIDGMETKRVRTVAFKFEE